ncbi:transcriptional regulator [Saccharopolyspora mangrovi]|uniref:Transcriptional regulator n=1 Tax=Saccharopolyspora mangrovi TaxID=3082379 RepID=A0ABU6AAI8_9PSEU|nr:transcriptional regulator [Saccharopolyspora sp. S2-29]MEB3368588.1 transcriptional regulator [Saccharopolyspora sp. S2-29]
MDRRSMLSAGAASVVAFGMGGTHAVAETGSAEPFRVMFDQLRKLGQTASPSLVLPSLVAQTHSLREMARNAKPAQTAEILALTARYAEFAGWMTQEAGDDRAAMWWTDRSVELAEAGGDRRLGAHALVRRALVALYRHDARQTVEVAQLARRQALTDRIRGWAALHEAQGHALAGDHARCMRTLDVAREHLSAARPEPGPTLGASHLSDPATMIAGWCLHDLGRPRAATEVLDREVSALPEQALRSRARYGLRRALAHAAAGEIEHACALTTEALPGVDAVTSATVLTDLRKLSQLLTRHHRVPAVQALQPALVASLHHRSA